MGGDTGRDPIICTMCAPISRGIVGDCVHVKTEIDYWKRKAEDCEIYRKAAENVGLYQADMIGKLRQALQDCSARLDSRHVEGGYQGPHAIEHRKADKALALTPTQAEERIAALENLRVTLIRWNAKKVNDAELMKALDATKQEE
jgi:hypothetical protein